MGIQINGQTDTISATDGSLNLGGTVTVNVTGDATGLSGTPNINVGVLTAASAVISGNLQVDGTTTTLDTLLTEVDKLEVGANNTTVGVAITQSGTGDILRLYDGATQVVTVKDGGSVGIGTDNPSYSALHISGSPYYGATLRLTNTGTSGGDYFILSSDSSWTAGGDKLLIGRGTPATSNTKIVLDSSGNIGIGTDNPLVKLDSRGTVQSTGSSRTSAANWISAVGDNSAYDNMRMWYTGYNSGSPRLYLTPGTSPGSGDIYSYLHLQSYTNPTGSNNFGLIVDGQVGIGTDNPISELMIENATQSHITVKTSGSNMAKFGSKGNDVYVGGTAGAANIIFKRNITSIDHPADSGTETLRITSGGRIGIGSQAPGDPLDIADNDPAIRLTDIDGQVYHRIRSSSQDLLIECDDGAAGAKPNLRFQVGNDEKFRVTGVGGSFGIGTNDPQTRFHVNATIDDDDAPQWAFHLTQDDPLNSINQLGGSGIGILFKPATNSDPAIGAGIAAEKPGGSDSDTTTDLVFYTSQNDETLDEAVRITSDGQLRSQATYDGSATTSNTFPCLNLNNLQGSYTANNFIGGITFGKAPGHGNGIRAGMLALYASTGSIAGNIGTQLSFRTSTESGGDGQERLRISSIGQLSVRGTSTAFDGTGGLSALQMYYETDSGQASIGPYSSGGSTHLSFYTNSGGAAATEKLRISSTGNVLIDSASNGSRYPQYQILTGSKTFGTTSGAWTDVARVGHSHAIEITYMVVQGGGYSFGGAHGTSLMNTRYGSSSGEQVLHRNTGAMNGGEITGHELRYLNSGGSTDYLLQARVTFTGTTNGTFTMGYSIKGHSSDLMYNV